MGLRILLICTEKLPVPPIRGGAIQTYIEGVLPSLNHHHEVTVLCRTDPDLPETEVRDGVRYVRVGGGERSTYFQNVVRFLATSPPFDLIDLFNRPAYLPLVAHLSHGASLILSMHNDMFGPDRMEPAEGRAILGMADAVVTISDYVGRMIEKLHPGHQQKLFTIRSGVDTGRFMPFWAPEAQTKRMAVRAELAIEPDVPVILHVGRLSPKKGNHLVIQAMPRVLSRFPEAVLVMVGSSRYGSADLDDYGKQVQAEASALGAHARITGFVPPDRVDRYFAAGDLFVCTSQWQEPLARVHYEAMASGLPIITTDRGGNLEVAEEDVIALVARPHDEPGPFAAHIETLLADPQLRLEMGRHGRAQVEREHSWNVVGRALLRLFEQTVRR
jgi:spore coat protein SA